MTAFLDTSVIVRYLTGLPVHLFSFAKDIIDADEQLALTSVVIAEAAYVLTSFYRLARSDVVDALVALIQRENMVSVRVPKELLIQALLLCRPSGRVSFADAMLWAEARSTGPSRLYTFDAAFPAEGLELRSQR